MLDQVRDGALVAEFSDYVAVVPILQNIESAHYVGMLQSLKSSFFVVQQVDSHLIVDLAHIDDFNGDFLPRVRIEPLR